MTEKFTIFRYPLGHSFSSAIYQAFAQQMGVTLEYTQTEVIPGTLQKSIADFRAQGGMGANVTMPLKEEAYGLCERVTTRAQQAQSVNILYWQNDILWGDTTDGVGLIQDITFNHQYSLRDKVICILGAGGAVAGIISALAQQMPKAIWICNRTPARSQKLTERFNHLGMIKHILNTEELNRLSLSSPLDWIINAISTGHTLTIANHVVKNTMVYDLSYSRENPQTDFIQWALAQGAKAGFSGLGMLVEQAAENFAIWHPQQKPDTQAVLKELRTKKFI